jgi:hypothetical protein
MRGAVAQPESLNPTVESATCRQNGQTDGVRGEDLCRSVVKFGCWGWAWNGRQSLRRLHLFSISKFGYLLDQGG